MFCLMFIVLLLLSLLVFFFLKKASFLNTSKQRKLLILGSAPYMQAWVTKNLQWFMDHNYEIVTFNNSWKLVSDITKITWHSSSDHWNAGTYVPTESEKHRFNKYKIHTDHDKSAKLYNQSISTMFFNVLYHYIYDAHVHKYPLHIVVIGCDMIYSKEKDTFYSHIEGNKAKSDPINRLGVVNLDKECNHSFVVSKLHNVELYNASEKNSRLPYPRFTNHST